MAKKIALVAMLGLMTLGLCSCGNRQWMDTTWRFNYTQIRLPDGSYVEGAVDSWKDFEDGDCIQVKINGVTYLTHYSNVVMIAK